LTSTVATTTTSSAPVQIITTSKSFTEEEIDKMVRGRAEDSKSTIDAFLADPQKDLFCQVLDLYVLLLFPLLVPVFISPISPLFLLQRFDLLQE
jgi:hypothetical protein